MKLAQLRLTYFRSHRDTSLDLDRVNIVRGDNGAGKTSLALAIEFLLTGRCDMTDTAGRGAQELIELGRSELEVTGVFDTGCRLTRRRNHAGGSLMVTQEGKISLTGKLAQDWLESEHGPAAVVSAVLNSRRFLQMSPAEQKALLGRALAAQPVEIAPPVRDFLAQILPGYGSVTHFRSLDELEAAYKLVYDFRTEMGREMKALDGALGQRPQKPEGMPSAEDVRRKLHGLHQEHTQKVTERSTAKNQAAQAEQMRDLARKQKEQHEPLMLGSADVEKLSKIAGRAQEAAKLSDEIERLQRDVGTQRTALAQAQDAKDACHACGRPYDDAALESRKRAIAEASQKLGATQKALEEAQTKRLKLGDPAQALKRLEEHKAAMLAVTRADDVLNRKHTEVNFADLDDAIATLETRIQDGEKVLSQVSEYDGQAKAHDANFKKLAQLDQQHKTAESIVELLGPKGALRGLFAGEALPAFRDRINEVLDRFGFRCLFELEPYELTIQKRDDPGPPLILHQLSESEQLRFAVAFQVALAEATGVGLVVIDRADMLTPISRRALTAALLESQLDQALVLATVPDDTPEPTAIQDVAFFKLDKQGAGGTTRLAGRWAQEAQETDYVPAD
jgi:DNA repair exonuclease SbcCD ATPase subunit